MRTTQSRRQMLGLTAAAIASQALPLSALAQSTGVPKMEGLSEKLLVSHYENNYSGAVKRLNAITAQLASLDVATAPVFVVNGLKREELIATNSMIIHELYFDGLGG